jgi:hypothetical protein
MNTEYTFEDYQESIKRLYDQSINGCGNHGCLISRPTGMGTNSSCKCTPREIIRNLRRIADRLEQEDINWK